MSSDIETPQSKDDSGIKLEKTCTSSSVGPGKTLVTEDGGVRDFYSSAVNESYRLKSELIAEHLSEIGTGRYTIHPAILPSTWNEANIH